MVQQLVQLYQSTCLGRHHSITVSYLKPSGRVQCHAERSLCRNDLTFTTDFRFFKQGRTSWECNKHWILGIIFRIARFLYVPAFPNTVVNMAIDLLSFLIRKCQLFKKLTGLINFQSNLLTEIWSCLVGFSLQHVDHLNLISMFVRSHPSVLV